MAFEKVNLEHVDAVTRAATRVLLQFRYSPVFQQVLQAFILQIDELITTIEDTIVYRSPADAVGEQLDVLGRIVGSDRELVDFSLIGWFTADSFYYGVDQAPAWVTNANISDNLEADDFWYRQLIEGKIFRNFVQYGSIPELKDMIKKSFGIECSIIRTTELLTVAIIVPDTTPLNTIQFLLRVADTKIAEQVHLLPIPATVKIAQVLRYSDYTP